MRVQLRPPDFTFVAAAALVAIVQTHYWELASKVGGVRRTQYLLRDLTQALFNVGGSSTSAFDYAAYRHLDQLTDVVAISLFVFPALAILLVGRIRSPRVTIFALRIAAALYVAWLLVLSRKVSAFILS